MCNKEIKKWVLEVNKYIEDIKSLPKEQAEKECRESLIRSGVLDSNGNVKEHIIEYCHY